LTFGLLLSASETADMSSASEAPDETLSFGRFFFDFRGAFFGAAAFFAGAFALDDVAGTCLCG
jgi:hypothetical protein